MNNKNKIRILIADDDALMRLAMQHFLGNKFLVKIVSNGKEALTKNLSYFDIVLTDVNMPELDGIEMAKIIRGRGKTNTQLPIVGMTANTQVGIRSQCLEAGMNEVLEKPILPNQIENVVRHYVKGGSEK